MSAAIGSSPAALNSAAAAGVVKASMKTCCGLALLAGGGDAARKLGIELQVRRKRADIFRAGDRQQFGDLLHGHFRFAARDQFGDAPARPQHDLVAHRFGDAEPVSSLSKYIPLVPSVERTTDLAASNARLNASVVTSGFAAPLRTDRPSPERPISAQLSGQSCPAPERRTPAA